MKIADRALPKLSNSRILGVDSLKLFDLVGDALTDILVAPTDLQRETKRSLTLLNAYLQQLQLQLYSVSKT